MKRIMQDLTHQHVKQCLYTLTLSCVMTSSTTGFSVPVPSSAPSTVFCFRCLSFSWSVFTFSRSLSNSERSWANWRKRQKYQIMPSIKLSFKFPTRVSSSYNFLPKEPWSRDTLTAVCISGRLQIYRLMLLDTISIQDVLWWPITVFLSALNSCSFFSSSSWTVSNSFSSLPSFNNAESFLERS